VWPTATAPHLDSLPPPDTHAAKEDRKRLFALLPPAPLIAARACRGHDMLEANQLTDKSWCAALEEIRGASSAVSQGVAQGSRPPRRRDLMLHLSSPAL